jgi:hypothetical protein
MGNLRFYILLIFTLFISVTPLFADDCLNKRKEFIEYFQHQEHGHEYGKPKSNVHQVEDIFDDDQFKHLCEVDQAKFKRIVYSTFRLILLDDENNEIEIGDDNEITGTLVGERALIVSFPEHINSFINYWKPNEHEYKDLKLKLINYDGEEGVGTFDYKVARFHKLGDRKTAAVLLYSEPLIKINQDFADETPIGLVGTEIIGDYNGLLSADKKNPKSDIMIFGYGENMFGMNDFYISFGLNTVFKEYFDQGKINVATDKYASDITFGGGAYDANFNMIGLHYYTTVFPYSRGLFNVVDKIPADIANSAWNFHRIDEMLKQRREDKNKKEIKSSTAPMQKRNFPNKGTRSRDY